MRIDVHAHFIPTFLYDLSASETADYGLTVEEENSLRIVRHREGFAYPAFETFSDGAAMIDAMDRIGLDARIVSLAPPLFLTGRPVEVQGEFLRRANDFAAELSRQHPGRLWAMGSVPLPHVDEAVVELERFRDLGLVGVEIPCVVGNRHLDDPAFRPFFQRAAELGLPVFLHPVYVGPKPGLEDYYFVNSIGNPYDTTLALARLLHSGVLRDLPDLRLLAAHGGGYFPYQRGRFRHAWRVRPEPKRVIDRSPLEYTGGIYYDTLTHDAPAIRFLIEVAGPDHVMMGSDFPFDMGCEDVVADVQGAGLPEFTEPRVLGANAVRFFGLGLPAAGKQPGRG